MIGELLNPTLLNFVVYLAVVGYLCWRFVPGLVARFNEAISARQRAAEQALATSQAELEAAQAELAALQGELAQQRLQANLTLQQLAEQQARELTLLREKMNQAHQAELAELSRRYQEQYRQQLIEQSILEASTTTALQATVCAELPLVIGQLTELSSNGAKQ